MILVSYKKPNVITSEGEVAVGATIVGSLASSPSLDFPPVGMVQAWVPHNRVQQAARLPWVSTVTAPGYPQRDDEGDDHPINPLNSEGVALHNADLAQAAGITGAGVNIGAISTGVASLAQSQALNELPAVTVLKTNGGDEGTAMLEIIHDVAPDAGLLYDEQLTKIEGAHVGLAWIQQNLALPLLATG